jgi:hypothetical protein
MVRNRLFILLGAGLLGASGARADGVAYVDCASHPEETQVFAKPRRTPDAVAIIPCGERFTLLLNGFIFSRVQTRDGQVGYVYSSVISMDRSGAAVPPPNATRLSASASVPAVTPKPAESKPAAPAPVQAAAQQPAVRAADTTTNAASTSAPNVQASTVPSVSAPSTSATATQATQIPAPSATASEAAASSASPQATPSASLSREQLEAAAAASLNATHPEAAPVATAQPETTVAAPNATAQPEANSTGASSAAASTASQPEPAPAEPPAPAVPAIRAEKARESWERPNAGGRRFLPLFELYGGYAFTRFDSGAGAFTNFNGVLGSFGWNFKPWLQLVADSSYSVVTVSGTKNVLYGNHWGPRVFMRGHGKWSITPFVEGLVGGTRADTTVSGVGGYKTSENVISYKVGGGLDIKPSRRLEIRVLNIDYYRTSFGTNVHQNNYWASAGIVLRLFGGSE